MRNLLSEKDRDRLLSRLRRLHPHARGRWGRMSAHQMVCHLADGFRVSLGDKHALPRPTRLPVPLMKFVAFRVPLRWPKGFPSPPEIRQGLGGTRPDVFDSDLHEVFALIDRFASSEDTLAHTRHPIFGPLTAREWGRWAYLHTSHHLRQFGC